MIKPNDFFDLTGLDEPLTKLFKDAERVWDVLAKLTAYLEALSPASAAILGQVDKGATLINPESIYIGPGTIVEAGAYIAGPAYIGANCTIRHGAYLRGSVMTGDECVLGHASEFKNAILLPGSHASHFAYVGDSILGRSVNLGAGVKLANLELFSDIHKAKEGHRPNLKIRIPAISAKPIDTGLTKLGAILGDEVQIGCNVVANPGCLVGRKTIIYANTSLRKGYYEPSTIIKLRQSLEVVGCNTVLS